MSEFLSKHCTDEQAKQIIAAAGMHRNNLNRWKKKSHLQQHTPAYSSVEPSHKHITNHLSHSSLSASRV